jgi:hypothetical protein
MTLWRRLGGYRASRWMGIFALSLILARSFIGIQTAQAASGPTLYMPLVSRAPAPGGACPATSSNQYSKGTAYRYDKDNPVRSAQLHADKNLDLRGYTPNTDGNLQRTLVNYGTDDPTQPPQFATLFSPHRVPDLTAFYRVYDWHWAPSPEAGSRGAPLSQWPVTALGLRVTPGEALRVPVSGYDIG